jgi:hypothetical protein
MARLLGKPPAMFDSVEDYEATAAPVFAWRDTVARYTHTGAALNGAATATAWQALKGGGARSARGYGDAVRWLRSRTMAAAFPLAVVALNRAGIGPLRADISMRTLRRAGLEAMGEVAARLDLGDAYVVFGHTHRAGPLPDDDEQEWLGRGGARLVNCGSWTYASIFLGSTPGEGPYWPGVCVLVADDGPPTIERLLLDRTRAQLDPLAV